MNKFDSIQLYIPGESILYRREEVFPLKYTDKLGRGVFEYRGKQLGLNKLVLDEDNNTKLSISSKLLKRNYSSLIHRDNIQEVLNLVNSLGIIQLDIPRVFEQARVFSVDVTSDVTISEPDSFFRTLNMLPADKSFRKLIESAGLVYSTRNKRENISLTIYDKFKEISLPRNKGLRKYIEVESFRGVIRFETKIKTFKGMRELFLLNKRGDVYLNDILQSSESINAKIFNRIYPSKVTQATKGNIFSLSDKHSANVKELGEMKLMEMLHFDMDEIKNYLNTCVKGNKSSYINRYRVLITKMANEDSPEGLVAIDNVRELLRVA
jgi:hypothetical protein